MASDLCSCEEAPTSRTTSPSSSSSSSWGSGPPAGSSSPGVRAAAAPLSWAGLSLSGILQKVS